MEIPTDLDAIPLVLPCSNGRGGGGAGGGAGEQLSAAYVEELCNVMEAVFLHELKNSKVSTFGNKR